MQRRAFLTRMTAAGLGSAAVALLSGCGSKSGNLYAVPTPTPTPTTPVGALPADFPGIPGRSADEVVLNFALTLEILEADLYRQALNAASGRALTTALDPTAPPSGSTGAYTQKVGNGSIASNLAFPAFLYLVQYAYVEAAHRDFLTVVLQSLGAPMVTPNPKGYTTGLNTSAIDLGAILGTILVAEEEGTRAYLGAAGFMNDPVLLTTAVAIYSTECRHAAAVNYVLGKDIGPHFMGSDLNVVNGQNTPNPSTIAPVSDNTFQYYRTPKTVLSDVQPFIVK
jgi:hypothetical protein